MSKTILYLHGFNSSGNGNKAEELRQKAMKGGWKILTPTLDYKNFDTVIKQLKSIFLTKHIDTVIGTSLGGFFAIYGGCTYNVPCVAVNPTTRPHETLKKKLGENKNFVTKQVYVLTESDLDKYKVFAQNEFSKIKVDDRTTFLLSNDDEVLGDHHYLEQLYPDCHNFHYFDGLGHRFASVKTILSYVRF